MKGLELVKGFMAELLFVLETFVFVMNGLRFPNPPAECMLDKLTGIVALRFVGDILPNGFAGI